MTRIISNVLEPHADPLGALVAHVEDLGRFVGSSIRLAQAVAHVGYITVHLIAVVDDVLDLVREATTETIRARDVIDPEDRHTSALATVEELLSASVRALDDVIKTEGTRGAFARPLRRLSEKLHDLFEEIEALRIHILEHDADADPETIGPFETADKLLEALHE